MLMRHTRFIADVCLRVIMVMVFVPHALGKLFDTDAFMVKFAVPEWQTLALGAIELAAALAALAGLFLRRGRVRIGARVTLTRLAALGAVLSQVLAIVYAHHSWLEYMPDGMEYNVTLILVALALAAVPTLGVAARERETV